MSSFHILSKQILHVQQYTIQLPSTITNINEIDWRPIRCYIVREIII